MSQKYRVLRGFYRIDHENGEEPYAPVGSVYEGPIDKWYLEDDPDAVRDDGSRGIRVGGDGAGPLLAPITPTEAKRIEAEQPKDSDDSGSTSKPADSGKEN